MKDYWIPNQLIDELPNIKSEAELKVILYILLRLQDVECNSVRITNDEFCQACGLAKNSVRSGVKAASEHGYILVEEDASIPTHIMLWYSVNCAGGELYPGRPKRGACNISYKKPRRAGRNGFRIAYLKKKLQDMHGETCSHCGEVGGVEAHHILPVAEGGADTIDNLTLLCKSCHYTAHGRQARK